jgi:hypothetical protein
MIAFLAGVSFHKERISDIVMPLASFQMISIKCPHRPLR